MLLESTDGFFSLIYHLAACTEGSEGSATAPAEFISLFTRCIVGTRTVYTQM